MYKDQNLIMCIENIESILGTFIIEFYMLLLQTDLMQSTYHFNLSFAPAENVELFNTSPISSLQKLKLLIVHM